jgi:hypothetical protein
VVTPSSTTFTRGLESNSTATGILIFSELHGYATQQLSGHAASSLSGYPQNGLTAYQMLWGFRQETTPCR